MEFIAKAIDFFLHLDKHLGALIQQYGVWTYAILFVVIFCETGLVVTPFLPGDSLLFAAGALAAGTAGATGDVSSGISLVILCPLLIVAAIVGDAVNFAVGRKLGKGFLEKEKIRFIKKEHLMKTQRFYDKYGPKTI